MGDELGEGVVGVEDARVDGAEARIVVVSTVVLGGPTVGDCTTVFVTVVGSTADGLVDEGSVDEGSADVPGGGLTVAVVGLGVSVGGFSVLVDAAVSEGGWAVGDCSFVVVVTAGAWVVVVVGGTSTLVVVGLVSGSLVVVGGS